MHRLLNVYGILFDLLYRASDRVRPKMGNCAALCRSLVRQKIPIVRKVVRQSILNFKCFRGAKWRFDWYFSLF